MFFLLLFLAKSLFDRKGKSDGFHFLFLDLSPFFSPESLTEMLDLTARPDILFLMLWITDLSLSLEG